jgi:Phage terminase large subunit
VATVEIYRKQQQFLRSNALLRAFVGGIGSGKSWVGAYDLIKRSKKDRLYLVTAPTYPMLADATFRSVQAVARQLGVVGVGDAKTSPPPSIKLRTGAEVLFRSTDNPETLRGPNLSGVWMDEASLSKREAFDILVGRLRESGEQGWMTATFTPKGKSHWTYKVFGTERQPDVELVHAASEENPFLPPTFVANVRKRYTAQQARQELGGAFVDGGGNHYFPHSWPRYADVGDAYRMRDGDRYKHIRKAECARLIALDWAMGKPKKGAIVILQGYGQDELKGDCTAFCVADLTPDGMLLLLDAVNERIPIGSSARRLEEMCIRWDVRVVAGDDDNLSEAMVLECRRYRGIPEIKCLPIGSRNKLVRSQPAFLRAERGMVLLPDRDYPWVDMLEDHLAAFTGADGEPDDLADAVGILGRLADEFKPGEVREDDEPLLGAEGFSAEMYDGLPD